ncbi:antitoxin [Actinomycetospora chibensis]|uniref:Rv0909 family putative TA system antitoxin n=1 Tax=Actinomycetospora chibensis TaxID=663606 RepID=A0ABV9RBN7_9PSEU|nr:Rv0909 family putative TA system antitoxin [Actinomycetospora chibensis]MDD7922628.1 Rv0909 family putative TA system antitoxin [Actinomycetospora chibensis]
MSRDDYVQQGKQFANDLRDTASKKVADNEDSILGAVGKAARWVDQKTGGKYADRIGKAEAKVGESVGRVAKQGTGEPKAPGAAAGDGTEPVTPPSGTRPAGSQPPGTQPPGSTTPTGTPDATPPHAEGAPAGPGAATTGPGPTEPPTGPVGPPTRGATEPTRPTHPPRDDAADWPRPPQS